MNKQNIHASIICCLYNEVNLIDKRLIDCIKQIQKSELNIEIIILDNNSTDGTKIKLKKL